MGYARRNSRRENPPGFYNIPPPTPYRSIPDKVHISRIPDKVYHVFRIRYHVFRIRYIYDVFSAIKES